MKSIRVLRFLLLALAIVTLVNIVFIHSDSIVFAVIEMIVYTTAFLILIVTLFTPDK